MRSTGRAKIAPGDAWGGGGLALISRSHLLPSLLLSALLPFLFFNSSFAYFWLAVRLSLNKKLDRYDPNKVKIIVLLRHRIGAV